MAWVHELATVAVATMVAWGCGSSSPDSDTNGSGGASGTGGVAAGGSAGATGGSAGSAGADAGVCTPAYDISGTYMERYNCSENGVCVDEDTPMTVMVAKTGTDPAEFSFNSISTGWHGKGLLCDELFSWNASEEIGGALAYTETGVWKFSGQLYFEKTSTYTSTNGPVGQCTGYGSKPTTPPKPPPVGGCP